MASITGTLWVGFSAQAGDGYARVKAPFVRGEIHPVGFDLNDAGEVVGIPWSVNPRHFGFFWSSDSGEFIRFGEFDLGFPQILRINDLGVVAGTGPGYRGFRWSRERGVERLPGGTNQTPRTAALDVNNSGDIVGVIIDDNTWRASIWKSDGSVLELPGLLGLEINQAGDALSFQQESQEHGEKLHVRHADGRIENVEVPLGWSLRLNSPAVLNELPSVSGAFSRTIDGRERSVAFVWSPTKGWRPFGAAAASYRVYAWNNASEAAGLRWVTDTQPKTVFLLRLKEGIEIDLGPDESGRPSGVEVWMNDRARVVWTHRELGPLVWDDKNGMRSIRDLVPPQWRPYIGGTADINNRGQVMMNGTLGGSTDTLDSMTYVIDLPTEGASPLRLDIAGGSIVQGDLNSLADRDGDVLVLESESSRASISIGVSSTVHRPQSIDIELGGIEVPETAFVEVRLFDWIDQRFATVGPSMVDDVIDGLRVDLIDASRFIDQAGRMQALVRVRDESNTPGPLVMSIDQLAIAVR